MPGIASMSGTLARNRNSILVCRKCSSDEPGHGRMYMIRRDKFQRIKITENEIAARRQFADVQRRIAALTPEEMSNYKRNFRDAQGKFNGKKYKTLRGYISAVIYNSMYSTPSNG